MLSDRRHSPVVKILVAALGAAVGLSVAVASVGAQRGAITLVVCAPGYPGSTSEAQPAMDALALAVAAGAGWKPGELQAVYFEAEKDGLDRLAAPDAAVLLAALPFWLQHHEALKLAPQLQVVEQGGEASEAWTLVAPTGVVKAPAGLAGFELVSSAGYSPNFVRGPALGPWGALPPDLRITFSNGILTALRRASLGNKVAVLLDRASAAALSTLPFASKLQVMTRSGPLPVAVLSTVDDRLPPARVKALVKNLLSLDSTQAGKDALTGVRLSRFVAADQAALNRAQTLFDRAHK